MNKKILLVVVLLTLSLTISGCTLFNRTGSDNDKTDQSGSSKYVTDRTDYTIFYTESSPEVMGSITTHQYIVGHSLSDAESIKYNAYLTPWKISFSQVQRTSLSGISTGCNNLEEQVINIEGYIEIDFSDLGITAEDLPNAGPFHPKGSIHETVSGTAGTWNCPESDIATRSNNAGSAQYVQQVSGEHTANFSGASNMTNLTVEGADIYLDLSYEDAIQFIWPAGTKIEYAPEGTPIPLEPLAPNQL